MPEIKCPFIHSFIHNISPDFGYVIAIQCIKAFGVNCFHFSTILIQIRFRVYDNDFISYVFYNDFTASGSRVGDFWSFRNSLALAASDARLEVRSSLMKIFSSRGCVTLKSFSQKRALFTTSRVRSVKKRTMNGRTRLLPCRSSLVPSR